MSAAPDLGPESGLLARLAAHPAGKLVLRIVKWAIPLALLAVPLVLTPLGMIPWLAQYGVGVLLTAFLTPPIARRIGGWRWITWMLATTAVVIVAFGLPFKPGLLVVAVMFTNFASQGIKIVVDTLVQTHVDDEFRGRVFSLYDVVFNVAFVAAAAVAAVGTPAMQERLKAIGSDLVARERMTPEYLAKFVADEIRKWAGPIRASGVQL